MLDEPIGKVGEEMPRRLAKSVKGFVKTKDVVRFDGKPAWLVDMHNFVWRHW